MKTFVKFYYLQRALESAEVLSTTSEYPDGSYVILSGAYYYIEDSGFIRSFETLIAFYKDGKRQKL